MTRAELHRIARHPNVPQVDTTPIRAVLGDLMPSLAPSPAGRLRLLRALRAKFGAGFKTFEAARKVLKHYDDEVAHIKAYLRVKGVSDG